MRRADYPRWLFLVAATFNFVVAATLSFAPDTAFPLLDMPRPQERLALDLFHGAVALFGLQYLWIALSPRNNRNLIGFGALGKTAVFAILVWHWLAAGDASGKMVFLASFDLAFAAAFLHVLWTLRGDD